MSRDLRVDFTDDKALRALDWFSDWYNDKIMSGRDKMSVNRLIVNLAIDFAELNVYRILGEKGYCWSDVASKWVSKESLIVSSHETDVNRSKIDSNSEEVSNHI